MRAGVQITEEKETFELEHPESNQNLSQVGAAQSTDDPESETQPVASGLAQREFTTTTVGDVLSVKQLVVWRGLTLLTMITILVAGVIISNFLVALLK